VFKGKSFTVGFVMSYTMSLWAGKKELVIQADVPVV